MMRAAGNVEPQPVLSPKVHPILHEALVKWKKDRHDYEAKQRYRCRVAGEDYEFQLNVTSVDVIVGLQIAELEHILGSLKNNALPVIKGLFSCKLKMNMSESDVTAQMKCKRLISSLEPPELKQEVKQCIRYTHADAEKNPNALFTSISRMRPSLNDRREEKPKVEQVFKAKQRQQDLPTAKFVEKVDPKTTTKSDAKPKPANLPRPPSGPCPKYSELHWLRECPSATEADKVELLKRFRNACKTKKTKLKRLSELLPTR
ncbi:hypothetical protein PHMEG_00020503 [Phytophthora megakarya]|uniref:Uncharacterized protein n=1 Tax=Phytophthora megakarya TaxID=4795 RepID=A0A225VPV7_9STRA|nr:hypothetical protein PHMEG_00020503 [Phytophthora megakarya]